MFEQRSCRTDYVPSNSSDGGPLTEGVSKGHFDVTTAMKLRATLKSIQGELASMILAAIR
ncbi:MAG: hypothetical protein ACOY93_04420 [Bacillota bacterium]